jgi:site-specific DNA-cytosine methylase
MAAGFRAAGIAFDLAFDYDADARASYAANIGHEPIGIDVRDLVRMARAGWSPGRVDLLVADPPCTPWSRAGKRKGLADERDMMGATVELIRMLRPTAYLVGNVPGLEDGNNRGAVISTIGTLAREGYCVRDFVSLDAADYGVPQHRVRPFWFGHLDGPCIKWPARTHGAPEEAAHVFIAGVAPLRPWVTCREALGHLAPKDLGRPVRLRHRACNSAQYGSVADRPARVVGTSNLSDGNVLVRPRSWHGSEPQSGRVGDPDAPCCTIDARPGRVGAGANAVLAWPWDAPATTIQADERIAGPGHHVASNLSTDRAVVLSELAAKILQGFPEDWHFAGKTKRARWSQLGMAIPPPLAAAVARSIAARASRSEAA